MCVCLLVSSFPISHSHGAALGLASSSMPQSSKHPQDSVRTKGLLVLPVPNAEVEVGIDLQKVCQAAAGSLLQGRFPPMVGEGIL